MVYQIIALALLIFAIALGFLRKINVGLVSLGLALILSKIGNIETSVIYAGFPGKLFITLLGTMFFFCLLQENGTLELLSKKMVTLVGTHTNLIPIIIYVASYLISAAGPGAISVQSVMVIFAVSLAVQMQTSPILMASMAILGAVGGTTSPIALTGIIVSDLTAETGYTDVVMPVFLGVSLANLVCASILYISFKGYKLESKIDLNGEEIPKFNKNQLIGIFSIIVLIVVVIGFRYDVGLVSFALALLLILTKAADEKKAIKMIPWNVLILICGVNVLMSVTKEMGGIDLLSSMLASLMNEVTAAPLIGLTAGIMSWFSSANGVVFPTLIPTVPGIISDLGVNISPTEMIIAIVGAATVAGISPLSTGGSLILASYSQETNASDKEQQKLFGKLFLISFAAVMVIVIIALVGGFKLFS